MSFYGYLLIIGLGTLPSLIWLYFFLKEDCAPEPKSLLAKTFLMGIIASPLAIIFQLIFACVIQASSSGASCFGIERSLSTLATSSTLFFLWAAFVEEVIKFYAVKLIVLDSPAFDEPTDGMIYMITAALGFATMENILVLYKIAPQGASIAANTLIVRFFGATLLHALSSALLGYFLANAWLFDHHKKKLIIVGLSIATVFHFAFNILLSSFESQLTGLAYATLLLIGMSIFIYILFLRVRKRYCTNIAAAISV